MKKPWNPKRLRKSEEYIGLISSYFGMEATQTERPFFSPDALVLLKRAAELSLYAVGEHILL